MNSTRTRFTIALLAATLFFAAGAQAQVTTGTVDGTVADPTEAVITGATVTLTSIDTGVERTQVTDATGNFVFERVRPGRYRLTIAAPNFQTTEVTELDVTLGRVTSLGMVRLVVGPAQTTITVEAGTAPLIEKSSAQISANYEQRVISENMWGLFNVDVLAFLTPGVQPGFGNINSNTSTGVATSFGGATNTGNSISSNGLRSRFTNFTLDGQDNNDLSIGGPAFFIDIPDVVSEYQITTNQFNADQGRNAGATVNLVTKSGTNQHHGSLWWFHGNSKTLDGTSSDEANRGLTEAAKFIDNQWGATYGGPIVKNRFFAFAGYQGIRQVFDAFIDPTAFGLDIAPEGLDMLRAAGFDANSSTIDGIVARTGFGLPTGSPFCQPGRLAGEDPAAFGATGFDPTNTFALFDLEQLDAAGNLVATAAGVPFCSIGRFEPGAFKQQEGLVKIDWAGTSNFFGGKYLVQQFTSGPFDDGLLNGNTFTVPGRSQYLDFYQTHHFSPRMLNEFRFSYGRLVVSFDGGTGTTASDPLQNPVNIFFAGPFNATGNVLGLPQGRIVNNFQWQDNWSLVTGRHTLKAGIEFRRIRTTNDLLFFANGVGTAFQGLGTLFNSGGVTTHGFNCLFGGIASSCGPASYEELLSNQLALLQKDFAPFRFGLFHTHQFYYFQDDFRVRPNLTLNIGLRYEYSGQPVNRIADELIVRESDPATAFWDTTLPVEQRTIPRLSGDKNNFAPRIGFAYTPRFWKRLFGEDKTVIRGGYAISYDVGFENPVNNIATGAPRVFFQELFPSPPIPGTGTGAELDADPNFAPVLGVVDPRLTTWITLSGHLPDVDRQDLYNAYAQQWSLGLQRELGPSVAEVRYVGTRGIGLYGFIERNPQFTQLAALFPELVPAGLTPDPVTGFLLGDRSRVGQICNCGSSIYHGLQTRWDFRNLFDQLTGGLSWTWSKNIDNTSEIFDFGAFAAGSFNDQQSPFDLNSGERARSNYDLRHTLTLHYIWDLPVKREQEGWAGKLLGGWQLTGQTFLYSGRPWTVFEGDTINSVCAEFDANPTVDDCRPFLMNAAAPLTSVGRITGGGICSDRAGNVVPCDTLRYILNDDGAVTFFGTPFGTGRNTETGDGTVLFNLGLLKNTYVGAEKRVNIQFRTHVVNLFNHRNFGVPDTDPDNTTFGVPQENNVAGRLIRFGLRVVF